MQLVEIQDKVLTRLGYGLSQDVKTPAPSVTVINAPQQTTNTQNNTVVVPVSPQDLEMARQALRRSEALKLIEHEPQREAGNPLPLGETALEDTRERLEDEVERRDEPLL